MKTTAARALWVGAMVGCALGALRAADGVPGAEPPPPDFRATIFWAYGIACATLAALSVWTAAGLVRVRKRVDELARRLESVRNRR